MSLVRTYMIAERNWKKRISDWNAREARILSNILAVVIMTLIEWFL